MNNSGLVLLQDLENPDRTEIFRDMEKFSRFFLRDRKRWWPDIPWPPDPLHQWSRQFEYPYAFYHVQATSEKGKKVLDAGSGVTFFPFYLAMHGYKVSCVDNDPLLNSAFLQLNRELPKHINVEFQNADLNSLPYEENSFSHICCISVLEHIPHSEVGKVFEEFKRVLNPSGICILTVDVSLHEEADALIRIDNLSDFLKMLHEHSFEPLFPINTVNDMCTLLTTVYFRKHNPTLLPWTRPKSDSLYHKVRYLVKTKILRRETFEPLGVAVFALRNQK